MKLKTLTILSIFFFSNCVIAQTDLIFKNGMEIVQRLNDTGITWGGDYSSGNNATCTSNIASQQDCHQGRDATHNDDSDGHAGFSFTKLDASGTPLADQSVDYVTTSWACVKDNVTGLVWEVKTTTSDIHNKDLTYKWGGVTALGLAHQDAEGTYYDDWGDLVNGTNSESLCGFDNWRVPRIDELNGIVNQGTFNPAIDTDYFPNNESTVFWSSSPIANYDGFAWIIDFGNGYDFINSRAVSYNVRLVLSLGQ